MHHRQLSGRGKKATHAPTVEETLPVLTESPSPLPAEAGGDDDDYEEFEQSANNESLDFEDNYLDYDTYREVENATELAFAECTKRPVSQVRVSADYWSPKNTEAPNCTFPFAFQGKIYYTCTNAGGHNKYWCANNCKFEDGHNLHFRGNCDIAKNNEGVLGTGIGLSAINVFVALLFVVGFLGLFTVLVVECCNRRRGRGRVNVRDDTESQKMVVA